MLYQRTITTKVVYHDVKNVFRQNFGGYIMYFHLYVEFWKHLKSYQTLPINPWTKLPWYTKFMTVVVITLQSIFKPLKFFYSYKTIIAGKYVVRNGDFENTSVTKVTIYYLFRLPFLRWTSALNEADIQKLLK